MTVGKLEPAKLPAHLQNSSRLPTPAPATPFYGVLSQSGRLEPRGATGGPMATPTDTPRGRRRGGEKVCGPMALRPRTHEQGRKSAIKPGTQVRDRKGEQGTHLSLCETQRPVRQVLAERFAVKAGRSQTVTQPPGLVTEEQARPFCRQTS